MSPEKIYNDHFRLIYRFFYYKLVDIDAEDLAQEVFLRFFKRYTKNQFSDEETKKVLFGIAQNVYKEWVRQAIKHQNYPLDPEMEVKENYVEFTDDEFELQLEGYRSDMREAIARLNPTLRQVIELRFLEGKTRAEVAEILRY